MTAYLFWRVWLKAEASVHDQFCFFEDISWPYEDLERY
jgi:hypothetical protein